MAEIFAKNSGTGTSNLFFFIDFDNTWIISLKVKISGPIASISFETISFDITLNINSATSIACIGVNFVSPL